MTDTVPRQAVIDAIMKTVAFWEAEAQNAMGEGHPQKHAVALGVKRQFERSLAAINAIPAVTVTDEMVERVVNAYGWKLGDNQMRMKAALLAAFQEKL